MIFSDRQKLVVIHQTVCNIWPGFRILRPSNWFWLGKKGEWNFITWVQSTLIGKAVFHRICYQVNLNLEFGIRNSWTNLLFRASAVFSPTIFIGNKFEKHIWLKSLGRPTSAKLVQSAADILEYEICWISQSSRPMFNKMYSTKIFLFVFLLLIGHFDQNICQLNTGESVAAETSSLPPTPHSTLHPTDACVKQPSHPSESYLPNSMTTAPTVHPIPKYRRPPVMCRIHCPCGCNDPTCCRGCRYCFRPGKEKTITIIATEPSSWFDFPYLVWNVIDWMNAM